MEKTKKKTDRQKCPLCDGGWKYCPLCLGKGIVYNLKINPICLEKRIKAKILKKVIKRAQVNGFSLYFEPQELFEVGIDEGIIGLPTIEDPFCEVNIKQVIFSHDFAKAFWGEKIDVHNLKEAINGDIGKIEGKRNTLELYNWQYHLQQMVLEPEPLDYLKKFLENA